MDPRSLLATKTKHSRSPDPIKHRASKYKVKAIEAKDSAHRYNIGIKEPESLVYLAIHY